MMRLNLNQDVKFCLTFIALLNHIKECIFITGVTYYDHTSIFSTFNHLEDLTLDSDYGALVGYTEDELENYFSQYIDNAADVLNKEK